jgi:catechol 2,3-dioxygenase-like lactoylglutathione lyase family enzyme
VGAGRLPAAAEHPTLGLQHFCVYVEDIDAARQRVLDAGGTVFDGPLDTFGLEGGAGNRWMYTRAPRGSLIEPITTPSLTEGENQAGIMRPLRAREAPLNH